MFGEFVPSRDDMMVNKGDVAEATSWDIESIKSQNVARAARSWAALIQESDTFSVL